MLQYLACQKPCSSVFRARNRAQSKTVLVLEFGLSSTSTSTILLNMSTIS
jgi:hypothetical protein